MKLLALLVLALLSGCASTTPPQTAPDCAEHPGRVYIMFNQSGAPEWHCLDNNGVKT